MTGGPASTNGSGTPLAGIAVGVPDSTGRLAPGEQAKRRPFFKRRSVLIIGAVVIFAAVSVVSDLPTHASRASQVASAEATISEINSDIGACSLGMKEAFTVLAGVTSNSLSAADRSEAPAVLSDDANACSYTNQSIVDLAGIQLPTVGAGKYLNQAVLHTIDWAFPDGRLAIADIDNLLLGTSVAKARSDLAVQEAHLNKDRQAVGSAVREAGHVLSTNLPAIPLTRAP